MRTVALAAAILLGTVVNVMAQITAPVSFRVFGRANRQPGTYFTATAQVPLGVYTLGITDTMTDADAADTANSFRLIVRVSRDGVDWTSPDNSAVLFILYWQGGTHVDKTTGQTVPNHVATAGTDPLLSSGYYTDWFVRGELDQPVAMRAGFDVVVYPAGFNP